MDIYLSDFKPILSLMNYKYKYADTPLIVLKTLVFDMEQPNSSKLTAETLVQDSQEAPLLNNPLPTHPMTPQFYEYAKPRS